MINFGWIESAVANVRKAYWSPSPDELRAWAARIESGIAPNGVNLRVLDLESALADLKRQEQS